MESLRDTPCARTAAGAARVIFGMAFGTALVAVGATPAVAHTALRSSNPREGARVGDALLFGRRVTRDLD